MLTTAGGVALKTRKGRTATVRPSTNLLTNSGIGNSTRELRLQRLGPLGIAGLRADLIAGFAWGEVHHA
jgi:hypothetical protein